MTSINISLTFDGNCREAFAFYKSVFDGEFQYIGTYGEMPPQANIPIMEDEKDKIMHVTLRSSNGTILMGNDVLQSADSSFVAGNNFTLMIRLDSKEEADALYSKLAHNGQATMPMNEVFWGSYYGMITDQFGIYWKLNVDLNDPTSKAGN